MNKRGFALVYNSYQPKFAKDSSENITILTFIARPYDGKAQFRIRQI